MKSLQYIPTRPSDWRRQARKLIQNLGFAETARKLGKTEEQLHELLKENSEAGEKWYKELLKKCVEKNPGFSIEEIAEILEVKIEDLK